MKLSPPGTLSCVLMGAAGDSCLNDPINGEELMQTPRHIGRSHSPGLQPKPLAAHGETRVSVQRGKVHCFVEKKTKKKGRNNKFSNFSEKKMTSLPLTDFVLGGGNFLH